jgi:hypothetical protein
MSPLLFSIAVSWGGTISGTIRGEAGGGIADADVYAINSQLAAARVQSDTAGGYSFDGLPAGWYRVWVLPPEGNEHVSRHHPAAAEFCDGALVGLHADSAVTDIDLNLPLGVSIEGRILAQDGQGVIDVRIRADSPTGSVSRIAHSDADGRFRVTGLEPGSTWQLQAAVSGTPIQWMGPSYSKDEADLIDPSSEAVTPDWTLLEGVGISGHAYGPDGPVPDAKVRIYGSSQLVQATTDLDGLFEVTGLPPGDVTAWAAAPGLATTYFPDHDRPTETLSADTEGMWIDGLDLDLPAEATVSLQLEGAAPRTAGDLSGLSIVLYNDSQSVGRAAQTDAGGMAHFEALHGGTYTAFVYASAAGHPDDWIRQPSGAIWALTLEGEIDNGTHNLSLAEALTVEGHVMDEDGRPVTGVNIILTEPDSTDTGQTHEGQFFMGTSDAEGRFEVVGVPGGDWTVRAQTSPLCPSDPGYVAVFWPDAVDPVMAEVLEIEPSIHVNQIVFVLPRDDDHDMMGDRWERRYDLDLDRNDAAEDPDQDGLNNLTEYRWRTDPRTADGVWVTEQHCGCSSASQQTGALWMVLMLGALRRRGGAAPHRQARHAYRI